MWEHIANRLVSLGLTVLSGLVFGPTAIKKLTQIAKPRTMLGEVLPVLGTVGLLGLWTFQQTGIEQRASELRKLGVAHGVFQTYQSHNALFNAIIESEGKDKTITDQIRIFQIYNYELGLAAIEDSLPPSEKVGIPERTNAYDGTMGIDEKMDRTQKRLEELQKRLAKRETVVGFDAEAARALNFWLYLGLSFGMITGAVLKAMDTIFRTQG
jgi:hypothetical protein